MLRIANTSLTNNSAAATGTSGTAIGGAVFHMGLSATFLDCRLVNNRALMLSIEAQRASGGALHLEIGSGAVLERCFLQHNAAGGQGMAQRWSDYSDSLAEERASSAMQIYSKGLLVLIDCDMTDSVGLGAFAEQRDSMWFWIVAEGGTVELRSSRFTATSTYTFDPCISAGNGLCSGANVASCPKGGDWLDCELPLPADAGPFGRLLNVRSEQVEVLLRRCHLQNLTLHSTVRMRVPIGIVNSTFDPPLARTLAPPTVEPTADCGISVAGAPLCDPRAKCEGQESGGVHCTCVGGGLHDKPGIFPDGQHCQGETRVDLLIQSQRILLVLRKPSSQNEKIQILVQATGEAPLNVSYNVSMLRTTSVLPIKPISSHNWSQVDEMQLDGYRLFLLGLLRNAFDLDGSAQRFVDSFVLQLGVSLNCTAGAPCIADGDSVTTAVEVGHMSGHSTILLSSHVSIVAQVEAIVSCEHSIVGIYPNDQTELVATSKMKVWILAKDIDGLDVNFTRGDIAIRWDGQELPYSWERGSNAYNADIASALFSTPGTFELTVVLSNGWMPNVGPVERCVLLTRTIQIHADTTQMMVAIGIAALMGFVFALLAVLVYRNRLAAKELLISFASFEGILAVEIGLDVWDFAGGPRSTPLSPAFMPQCRDGTGFGAIALCDSEHHLLIPSVFCRSFLCLRAPESPSQRMGSR
jgi:hypothetical protein